MSHFRLSAFALLGSCFLAALPVAAEEALFRVTGPKADIKVEQVVSVDTLLLENGERIKLIGVKGLARPRRKNVKYDQFGFEIEEFNPLVSLEERAFDFVRSLLEGQRIDIEFDVRKQNDQFQTLAYVFLSGDKKLINAEIVRQGYAHLHIQPPNTKYADALRAAYQEARNEKRGLHGQ